MDPNKELERLLNEHAGEPKRHGNHLVYEVNTPNGPQTFAIAKTTSDYRSAANNVSDLKRLLGISNQGRVATEYVKPRPPEPRPLPPLPEPEPEKQPPTLRERIEAEIAAQEAEQNRLVELAAAVDVRLKLLRDMLPHASHPATEPMLRNILPPLVEPKPELPPPPPQRITECVQVTKELVFAAIQAVESEWWTVSDLMTIMTGSRQVENKEKMRIRESINHALNKLLANGQIAKEPSPRGGRAQTKWQKVTAREQSAMNES